MRNLDLTSVFLDVRYYSTIEMQLKSRLKYLWQEIPTQTQTALTEFLIKMKNEMKTFPDMTRTSKKICVIEDDSALVRLIEKSLVREGFCTVSALNVEQILNEIKTTPDTVLLMDYLLPNTTSKEVIEALRKKECKVPFIIMTGHGDEKIAVEMMKLGARDYIVKDSGFLNVLPRKIKKVYEDMEKERRLAHSEVLLKESEQRYQTLFKNVPVGIVTAAFDGSLIEANQSLLDILRLSPEKVKKQNLKDWFFSAKNYQEFISVIKSHGKIQDWEVIFKRKSGKKIDMILNADVLEQEGEKILLLACRDITKRKMFEEALRQSEERFAKAFHLSPEGQMISRITDGTIIEVNTNWEKIFGYSRNEAIGQHIESLSLFSSLSMNENLFKASQPHAIFSETEGVVQQKNGQVAHIMLSTEAIEINNDSCVLTVIQDVTRRKQAELDRQKLQEQLRQSQKMEAIGRLAGGVAHDFNNLLTVIIGLSEILLADSTQSATALSDLQEIRKAACRATNLSRQLLAFNRRQPLELKSINLNEVIDKMQKLLGRIIGENIHLYTLLTPEIHRIKADEGQIEQVIMNIVVNACDAMSNGGNLTIQSRNEVREEKSFSGQTVLQPGNYICISIQDTGIGMSPETMEHIYEPFFTTKDSSTGTGLGLAMVYGIIKQHNGWIEVQSTLGAGTRFDIFLPQFEGDLDEAESENIMLANLRGKGERILLVEDDELVRQFASRFLRKNGYQVVEVEDAEKAEEIFEQENQQFGLVCTDVVLPKKNGVELADYLLTQNPQMPILLCSGYTDLKSQLETIRHKGYFFLNKPYVLTELLRSIREAIEHKS